MSNILLTIRHELSCHEKSVSHVVYLFICGVYQECKQFGFSIQSSMLNPNFTVLNLSYVNLLLFYIFDIELRPIIFFPLCEGIRLMNPASVEDSLSWTIQI